MNYYYDYITIFINFLKKKYRRVYEFVFYLFIDNLVFKTCFLE